MNGRGPGGFYCNCTFGSSPCGLYPAGRGKGRRGRCEGCAMGLHRGHELKREDVQRGLQSPARSATISASEPHPRSKQP